MPLLTTDHCPLPTEAGGASPLRLGRGEGQGEVSPSTHPFQSSRFEVQGPRFSVPPGASRPRPVFHLPSSIFAAVGVIRRPAFLLSVFCFLLLNASAAAPKFADLPVWVQPATDALPATSRMASNGPPAAASAVSQATTNLSLAASTNSMDALDDQHKLAIGDRLSFRIVEDEEDPKPLLVTDSGDLELPYLGRFPAVGRTCKQLARQLKTELEKEYYFQATVIIAVDIMTKSRGKVYLVGPVRSPGPQEIPSDEVLTLSKAILRAGGFGHYADKHKVRVTRKGAGAGGQDQVLTIDVAEILEKGKTESDLPLEPGDLIYVPERLIRF